jgi:NADPH:quinone reductase-like Zn-dependent oxidoreductase
MSYPTKIKAVGINETGGVEVIQNLEVPFPEVKPADLLVKVHHPSLSLSMIGIEVRNCLAG